MFAKILRQMRMLSFYLLCSVVCVVALASDTYGQSVDPATFFPHATGNQWHYRDIMNDRHYSDEWVDHDSSDGHGGWWVYYVRKVGTIPNPPLLMFIDSNLDVYERYEFSDPNPQLRYRLKAKVGDTWNFDPSDTSYKAEVIGISQGVVFGKVVTIMQIEYFTRYVGGEMWLQVHYLASGIGLIRLDSHPSARTDLTGATIDGTYYGDLASALASDPSDLRSALLRVFPNPSSTNSTIVYHVDRQQRIRMGLYDALGREVESILDSYIESGTHQVTILTGELAAGSYTVRISGATCNGSRRLSVAR
jgi:hypothetical protein